MKTDRIALLVLAIVDMLGHLKKEAYQLTDSDKRVAASALRILRSSLRGQEIATSKHLVPELDSISAYRLANSAIRAMENNGPIFSSENEKPMIMSAIGVMEQIEAGESWENIPVKEREITTIFFEKLAETIIENAVWNPGGQNRRSFIYRRTAIVSYT